MNDCKKHAENEPYSVQQQRLSDDSQPKQNSIEQEEDDCLEKERSSDILKKYLKCLKSPSGKRRKRCISQGLG